MTAIGADPEALDVLARGLRAASGDLVSTVGRIEAAISRSDWSGPDAERFRRAWQSSHRRAIQDGSARCRTLADRISLHAAEQRRASLATGAPAGGPHLRTAPTDATVLRGVISGSVGVVSASLTGTLMIEELGDRRRVTYTDDVTAGLSTSAGSGARARWNDHVIGKGAVAGVVGGLDNRVTRTWTVDEAELPMLLVGLAVEQGLEHSPSGLMSRSVTQTARLVDGLGDAVGGLVGIDVPDAAGAVSASPLPRPQRTEDLVGVVAGASAWAAVSGAVAGAPSGADTTASAGFRVGTAEEAGRRSLLFEAEGSAATAVLRATPVLAASRDHLAGDAGSIRVEVPVGSGDRRPVLITVTGRDPDGEEVVRVSVDPSGAADATRAARSAVARLRDGDVPGALRSLHGLRADDTAIGIDTSSVRVRSDRAAVDGVGTLASLAVEGTVERRSSRP